MDIRQIRYFSKVYELKNYAHAACALYISRQALRKTIQGLEQEVGQTLFVNDANRLQPTSAANALYRASRSAVKAFSELEADVMRMRFSRVDMIRYAQSRGALDVFAANERRIIDGTSVDDNPIPSKMITMEGTCAEVRSWILDGSADYANIIATSIDEALFDCEVVREGDLFLAVRDDHELASRSSVSLADLGGVPFGTQGPGFDVHELIEREASREGVVLNQVSNMSDSNRLLVAVCAGYYCSYAYRGDVNKTSFPRVVCVPFREPFMKWRLCTIAKKGCSDSYLLRYFAGKEIEAFRFDGL